MSAPPKRIWLQWHGELHWHGDPDECDYDDDPCTQEVTWSQDKIFDKDIEYVRADENDWITINVPFRHHETKESFQSLGLAQPGTLIETTRGVFLIGHINTFGSDAGADCGDEFDASATVIRYKVIWAP